MQHNIAGWLSKRAWISGDHPAVADPFSSCTYAELNDRCGRLATGLERLGVRPGDRVAGLLYNGTQFLELMFAAARLGAIFVPLNYRLSAAELGFILDDAGARVLFHHHELASSVGALDPAATPARVIDAGGGTDGEGRQDYERLIDDAGEPAPLAAVGPDDVAMMMYTSGTTGRPKGAMLSHANTYWNAIQSIGRIPIHRHDRLLVVAPMFHIGGLGVFALPGIYIGAALFIRPTFDPVDALEVIARERITAKFGVPAMWQAIQGVLKQQDYPTDSLELAVTGGSPCPIPVLRFFQERGMSFVEGFGLTETAPTATILDPEDAVRKNGSVGYPAMFMELAIVDEQDREVARGERGELVLRGPNVFKGYWNRPEATAEALRGGWFHTGDIACLDDEGFVYIVDRKKDMLISGGENVYPAEVEQVLYEHPQVADAAVIGVPDPRWQEVPRAIVVPREAGKVTEDDLIDFCRQHLAKFKTPKSVVFVEELPRSATGKVLKRELRDQQGDVAGGGASA